ncbi:hypothetical protein [Photobacterium sp. J15]|uniref:hypothetical protein n=1 Tax=Photobacterium sp. J15 TaxID=265901 RepID=UPI0007E33CE8|nr:hypothetical protein [Photobacterium sp. J15]
MKFAKYWEKQDVTVSEKVFGKDVISVWGASNESSQAAKENAEKRLAAMQTFFGGDFDKNDEYEYWVDFVKEEIIDEIKSNDGRVLAILSRNSYGATVLNTDSVLFGDIDVPPSSFIDRILGKFGKSQKDKTYYLKNIERYQENHPDLSFKVYETHSGLRFIVTNRTFSPEDSVVREMFTDLNVDPLYMRLCQQQECFRARLSPKPWRVAVERPSSRYPRVNGKEQQEFQQWLDKYHASSLNNAVTKYLASFGSGKLHPDIQIITELHDRYSCSISAKLA